MTSEERNRRDAEQLSNMLNSYSFSSKGVATEMAKQHRTLQQSFTRLCVEWLKLCGSDEYHYDARNEDSHELGVKLKPLLEDACLPFI